MYAVLLRTIIIIDMKNANYFVDIDGEFFVFPIIIGVMYFIGMPRLIGMTYIDDIFLRRDQCLSRRGSQTMLPHK